MNESVGLSRGRMFWVYLSLALMALPLVDGSWAVPKLLNLQPGIWSAAFAILSIALVLVVWLELARRTAVSGRPTWPLILWPLLLLALWNTAVAFVL